MTNDPNPVRFHGTGETPSGVPYSIVELRDGSIFKCYDQELARQRQCGDLAQRNRERIPDLPVSKAAYQPGRPYPKMDSRRRRKAPLVQRDDAAN